MQCKQVNPPPPATGLRLLLFQVKFEVFGVVCAGVADSEVALSDEHVGLITVKKKSTALFVELI